MPFLSYDVRVRALNVTRECCCDLGHLAEVFARRILSPVPFGRMSLRPPPLQGWGVCSPSPRAEHLHTLLNILLHEMCLFSPFIHPPFLYQFGPMDVYFYTFVYAPILCHLLCCSVFQLWPQGP